MQEGAKLQERLSSLSESIEANLPSGIHCASIVIVGLSWFFAEKSSLVLLE